MTDDFADLPGLDVEMGVDQTVSAERHQKLGVAEGLVWLETDHDGLLFIGRQPLQL